MSKFLVLLAIIPLCLSACQQGPSWEGKVSYVVDGDTVQVGRDRIRLLGVDTPEKKSVKYNRPEQCFAREAREFLISQINGKIVRLEEDPQADTHDKYRRRLAYIFAEDRLINLELVQKGYGFAIRFFPYSRKKEFIQAEDRAKKEKLGLWGPCKLDCGRRICKTLPLP